MLTSSLSGTCKNMQIKISHSAVESTKNWAKSLQISDTHFEGCCHHLQILAVV